LLLLGHELAIAYGRYWPCKLAWHAAAGSVTAVQSACGAFAILGMCASMQTVAMTERI